MASRPMIAVEGSGSDMHVGIRLPSLADTGKCRAHARVFAEPGLKQRSALAAAQDLITDAKPNGSSGSSAGPRAVRTKSNVKILSIEQGWFVSDNRRLFRG